MPVAYVVPKQGVEIDIPVVQAALERTLPAYMVPSAIISPKSKPINPNSKLDRFALPASAPVKRTVVEPETETEAELCAVWKEFLVIDPVGIDDNFFAIGSNSLGAIRIPSALRRRQPKFRTTIADPFNNPTIRDLARILDDTAAKPTLPSLLPIRVRGSQRPSEWRD